MALYKEVRPRDSGVRAYIYEFRYIYAKSRRSGKSYTLSLVQGWYITRDRKPKDHLPASRAPSHVRPTKMRVVATVMAHQALKLPCQVEHVQMPESIKCSITSSASDHRR